MLRKNLETYFGHLKATDRKTREEVAEMALDVILGGGATQDQCNDDEWDFIILGSNSNNHGRGCYIPNDMPRARIINRSRDIAKEEGSLARLLSLSLNRRAVDYLDDALFVECGVRPNGDIYIWKSSKGPGRKLSATAKEPGIFDVSIPDDIRLYIKNNAGRYIFNDLVPLTPKIKNDGTKYLILSAKIN